MRSKATIVSILGVAALSACTHASDLQALVAERAAFDLQCDEASMTIVDLPGMAYGVRGCGEQATYVITGLSCQHPRQLTKREAAKYCTPVLDHSGSTVSEDAVEPSDSPGVSQPSETNGAPGPEASPVTPRSEDTADPVEADEAEPSEPAESSDADPPDAG